MVVGGVSSHASPVASLATPSWPEGLSGVHEIAGAPCIRTESQAWWTAVDAADSSAEDNGHVHLATCFPHAQTITGVSEITFPIRVIMHHNPGHISRVRVQMEPDDSETVDVDWSCPPTQTCTFWTEVTIPLSGVTGSREFRFSAFVDHTNGARQYESTGWQACIRNCDDPSRDGPWIEARGWYTDTGYENVRVLSPYPWEGADRWQPTVQLKPGSGGIDMTHWSIHVDPMFHVFDPGIVLASGLGETDRFALDTGELSPGWHRLVLKGCADATSIGFPGTENCVLQVVPWLVTGTSEPQVDVEVTRTDSVDPVVAGSGVGNLTDVVTVTNHGPDVATGVVVDEAMTLPPGAIVESITTSQGTFVAPSWTVGDLAVGESAALTAVLTVGDAAAAGLDVITGTSTVSAVNEIDTSAINDTASESTSIAPVPADVAMIVTPDGLDFAAVGENAPPVQATVTISNAATATDQLVVSTLSVTTGNSVFSVSGGGTAGGSIVVDPGASHDVTITFDPPEVGGATYVGNLGVAGNGGTVDVALAGEGVPGPDVVAPVVVGMSPGDGEVGVPVSSVVSVVFDEDLSGSVDWASSFVVDGGAVAGGVVYDGGSRTATFLPAGDLEFDTEYEVSLSDGVTDVAGNSLVPVSWVFTTQAELPPVATVTLGAVGDAQVKSTSAARNYGSASTVRGRAGSPEYRGFVGFDVGAIDGEVFEAVLRLFVTDSSPVGGSFFEAADGWSESSVTWNSPPALGEPIVTLGAVSSGSWVEIDVTDFVDGAAGGGDGLFSVGFTTSSSNSVLYSSKEGVNPPQLVVTYSTQPPGPDVVAPVVVGMSPGDGEVGVPVSSVVSVVFDEDLSGSVDWASSFVVDGGAVAGGVVYDGGSRTATFLPAGDLEFDTEYEVSLSDGVTDVAGNSLVPVSWVFTTQAELPPVATVTLGAVGDAQVKSTSAARNYGSASTVRGRAGSPEYRGFVGFDVGAIDGEVFEAVLRLFVTDSSPVGGSFFEAADGWSESSVTWNSPPALGEPIVTLGAVSSGSWVEIDVTDFVDGAAGGGDGLFSVGFTTSSSNSVLYSSKEGVNPPQLVVTYSTQ